MWHTTAFFGTLVQDSSLLDSRDWSIEYPRPSHALISKVTMSDIISELSWRDLVYQTTDEQLGAWLNEAPRTIYAGFDPTADSLHVGSLLPLLMLRRFQRAGHRVIALVGGATGMIGDPSGKSAERNLLDDEQLAKNVAGIEAQMRRFLDFSVGEDGQPAARVVNNFDWMKKFSYIEFLRDIGKNFPVNVMMAKDSVKARLEGDAGISYTEFSYMLLQAYDFAHLHQEFGCELQIGGSDQWGNITAGIDLGRRMHSSKLYGLTNPLLTKSDGVKMGKTESGAIWISPERTSPYQFYQYWINVADADAGKCLRFLTDATQEEVAALDQSRVEQAHTKESQKRLAEELTERVHGRSGLETAQKATNIFFGSEINDVSERELREIFDGVSSCEISRSDLKGSGIPIVDAFHRAGLAKSKGESRRVVQQGGAYVNNRRREGLESTVTAEDLIAGGTIVLRSGRKKYALLCVTD